MLLTAERSAKIPILLPWDSRICLCSCELDEKSSKQRRYSNTLKSGVVIATRKTSSNTLIWLRSEVAMATFRASSNAVTWMTYAVACVNGELRRGVANWVYDYRGFCEVVYWVTACRRSRRVICWVIDKTTNLTAGEVAGWVIDEVAEYAGCLLKP